MLKMLSAAGGSSTGKWVLRSDKLVSHVNTIPPPLEIIKKGIFGEPSQAGGQNQEGCPRLLSVKFLATSDQGLKKSKESGTSAALLPNLLRFFSNPKRP